MKNELSIVIIGRNEEAAISKCLEAVIIAANEVGGAEMIFVDSHSTDNTVCEVQKYGVEVRSLDKTLRPSPSSARYFGAGLVKGDYVLFLDADTIIYPGFLSTALNEFRNDPTLAGVNGWIDDTTETGEPVSGVEERHESPLSVKWLRGPSCLYLRSALVGVGGFDPDLVIEEEAELGLRIVRAGWKLMVIPVPMARHTRCYHPTSARSLVDIVIRDFRSNRMGEITRTIRHAARAGNGITFCWLRLQTTILFQFWCIAILVPVLSYQNAIGRFLSASITVLGALALIIKKRSLSQAILFVPSKLVVLIDLLVGICKIDP